MQLQLFSSFHHCSLCLAVTGAADPFAIRSGGAPQGPPVSPPVAGGAEPVRPVGDINDWFRKLCQSPSGVLYEDNYLQVGPLLVADDTAVMNVLSVSGCLQCGLAKWLVYVGRVLKSPYCS